MKPKPDDRSNNVDRIQNNINHTIQNYRLAKDMIKKTDNEKTKETLQEKNERRKTALNGMRLEIKDEASSKQKRTE